MPIYEYKCECGSERDEILPFAKSDKVQTCDCGKTMQHKISLSSFAFKVYANQMALDTINKRGNGEIQGMPNRWWRPEAQRKAFVGTQTPPKTVW